MFDDIDMYDSLEDYFADHPEEENEFIDALAQLEAEKGLPEYPEDWNMLKYA